MRADIIRELWEPSRRSILECLLESPKTVSEICESTGLNQPNVSNHLARLRQFNLVNRTRNGRNQYYSLSNDVVREVIKVAAHSKFDEERRTHEPIHLPNFAADLIRGDESACWSQLGTEIECGKSLSDLYVEILIPAMRVLGSWYDSGKIDTAQEHVASHTVQRLVTRASNLFPRAPWNGKIAVLACADGDWHDLGIRMLNELLLHVGWSTTYVGASTPSDCLMNTVTQKTVDLVVLSSTVESSLPEALRCARDLVRYRNHESRTMKIVVGGRAAWSQSAKFYELGVDKVVETLQDAMCSVDRLLSRETPHVEGLQERN